MFVGRSGGITAAVASKICCSPELVELSALHLAVLVISLMVNSFGKTHVSSRRRLWCITACPATQKSNCRAIDRCACWWPLSILLDVVCQLCYGIFRFVPKSHSPPGCFKRLSSSILDIMPSTSWSLPLHRRWLVYPTYSGRVSHKGFMALTPVLSKLLGGGHPCVEVEKSAVF